MKHLRLQKLLGIVGDVLRLAIVMTWQLTPGEATDMDDMPSCDWTLEPHREDFQLLSSMNGAPTAWEFGNGQSAVRVSRTWHLSGLGHPCWDQTLRFETVGGSVTRMPVPFAVTAVVISGSSETVLGDVSSDCDSNDARERWQLTEGRAPDASERSSISSTSSSKVGLSNRRTYWLQCASDDAHAVATVTTKQADSAVWTVRVRLVRTCPGVWSHMAVNVAPSMEG